MKHPALWLGLACVAAGLLLLIRPAERAATGPAPGSATPPVAAVPPPATPAGPGKGEARPQAPSRPAAPKTEAVSTDFERWHRADLAQLCADLPAGPEIFRHLAEHRYVEAMQAAVAKAEAGDVAAIGLLRSYRLLCDAFLQGETLQDFQRREAYLLEGESPESAERIRAYLGQERAAQDSLARACPQIIGTSTAVAARFSALLHERAQSPGLTPAQRRLLAEQLEAEEPAFAEQQLKDAAQQGDAAARLALALRQMERGGTQAQEAVNAARSLREAAQRGSVEALVELGHCALHGCPGISVNRTEALVALHGAALAGHPQALLSLIELFGQGTEALKPNPAEAMAWALQGQALANRGEFNSASLEMRREFREKRAELEPRLSFEERQYAEQQAQALAKRTRPNPLPPECQQLLLSPDGGRELK